jgi:hypothetical protein
MTESTFSDQEILAILKEADEQPSLSVLCQKYGITPATLYMWQVQFDPAHKGGHDTEFDPGHTAINGIAAILVFVGLIYMAVAGYQMSIKEDAAGYDQTAGKIIKMKRARLTGSSGEQHYDFSLSYEFKVGDMIYHSTRVRPGKTHAHDLVKYPEGSTVTVYYQRHDPKQACLDPGVPGTIYEKLNTGLYLFLGGLLGFCLGWWYSVSFRSS